MIMVADQTDEDIINFLHVVNIEPNLLIWFDSYPTQLTKELKKELHS